MTMYKQNDYGIYNIDKMILLSECQQVQELALEERTRN